MCGIAGIAAIDSRQPVDAAPLASMLRCVAHRGPDDEGIHLMPGVALGHRRLSVIDVAGGHQPLFGAAPDTAIVCNGEIYNYRELAVQLRKRGHQFRTRSDTEVVAHAYDEWGLDFLDRLDGMFALALYDGQRRRLVLARDRMGEKPLYYAVIGNTLVFASELHALESHPQLKIELDLRSLSQYLALEYVPAPRAILKGVRKLEPGQYLLLEDGGISTGNYWKLRAARNSARMNYNDAVLRLRTMLDDAVKSRLVSDVPLGVFLSGGIDSSTVAALAAQHGALDTFSIGFDEKSFDESAHARAVARHIGANHHERILRGADMPDLVPRLPYILDEPLGDASIIPTALLSRFAREQVTVALGGDGGDELFGGYPMHQAHRVAPYIRAIPLPLRFLLERGVRALPVSNANFSLAFKALTFLKGAGLRPPYNHATWMSSFARSAQLALLSDEVWSALGPDFDPFEPIERIWQESAGAPPLARATHLDARSYLPDDILLKVDRASMQVALEVRAPFLARHVVEFAFSLPDDFRMKRLQGKRILRDAVRPMLPEAILQRPKKGFGIPVAAWLNGPLAELTNDVLSAESLRSSGLFKPDYVTRLLSEHRTGAADHRKPLWTMLVFELWRRHHLTVRSASTLTADVA